MTTSTTTTIAFLGCGNIAGPYAESLKRHPELSLIGAFDLDPKKRAEFTSNHGCKEYSDLDELCAASPDIVVNLTSAPYHYATTLELIDRGQIVFSEKPLAMSHRQAEELVDRAANKGVRLACAPSLWLGAATQKTTEALQQSTIGTVRMINAEVNQGRIETWHPAPWTFYQVGPVADAGVYALTYLTSVFGPLRRVSATAATLLEERSTVSGESFQPDTADAWIAVAEFASGQVLRLTCNFYVDASTQPRSIDFHGDRGSLRLKDWLLPGSGIEHAEYGQSYNEYAAADANLEIDWCLGLADLAHSIREDRPHQTTGEHAAHVVEVLEAITQSAQTGTRVNIGSSFPTTDSNSEQVVRTSI